jgi:D-alanyl-D-alanine dipeptidase
MIKIHSGVVLASLLVGCGSDAPPGASIAVDKTLPSDSLLAQVQNVSLIRAGDGFTLAGYDNGQVRWGRLALDGTLTQETSFAMAQPVVGPVFAATKKTTPGDQLVALAFVNSATVSEGYDLTATVQTIGAAAPAAPVALATLPAGTDPRTVQLAAGAAASGNVGYVAWGIRVTGIPISYLTLPADALTTATPSTFLGADVPANVPAWDCLAPQGRSTGFSFGAVTPDPSSVTSDFRTLEVDETGNAIDMTYQLTVQITNCRIVGAPTPAGNYFMAFQGALNGTTAIDFATYYPPLDPKSGTGTVTTQPSVLPSALFGGPLSMPRPAWVSSAGGDVVIGLERKSGPEVVRFTYNAVPHGSTLKLRSVNGNAGPVAAWVGDNAVYATYTDQVKSGSATATNRYFMRVDSPASLP